MPVIDGPRDSGDRSTIAVGETYDFEYTAPAGRGLMWLDVRSTSGKWQAQGQVIVK